MENQRDKMDPATETAAHCREAGLCVFDLDGTLVNTLGDITGALNHALSGCGLPALAEHQVSAIVGHSTKYMFQHAVPQGREEAIPAVGQAYDAYYSSHCCDASRPYEGILKCLTALKAGGVKLAVVSNKPHGDVLKILHTLFPKDLFSMALGHSQRFPTKPSPESLLFALDFFNVPRERAVYVGDSEVDVDFAKNAGLECLSVCWGFRTRQALADAGAETILDEPQELAAQILARLQAQA